MQRVPALALSASSPEEGSARRPTSSSRFVHSDGAFESRWVTVGIDETPPRSCSRGAGQQDGRLVAHGGEGDIPDPDDGPVVANSRRHGLTPPPWYPGGTANPNGATTGALRVCSRTRHLAMMPHPERAFLRQMPWFPPESGLSAEGAGPDEDVQNARVWAEKNHSTGTPFERRVAGFLPTRRAARAEPRWRSRRDEGLVLARKARRTNTFCT